MFFATVTKASTNYRYPFFSYNLAISIKDFSEDELLELLLENDLDAKDIEVEENIITVYTDPMEFTKTRDVIGAVKSDEEVITDELTMLPQIEVELEGEDMESFQKLINMLNECDDVQNIYHNVTNM